VQTSEQPEDPEDRDDGNSEPSAGVNPSLAQLPPPGRRALGLGLVSALLAYLAFGALLDFDADPLLESEFEGVFFTPSDTSPAVVLLLAGWLVYRRWNRLRNLPLTPGPVVLWAGLLGLSAAILAWSIYVGASDLRVLALMFAIQGLAALFGGRHAMRALAVPTLFLGFAMPMPAPLLNAMLIRAQLWTAEFAGMLLHLGGQTAFVTGDQILRDDNTFAIIETCSGIRITETLTMLTVLMLDLFRRRALHCVLLLALAPPVAFLCNGMRAVTLILNPHSDIAEVHALQGIAMLLGGLIALYLLDGLLGRLLPKPPPVHPEAPAHAAGTRLDAWRPRAAVAALAGLAAIALWGPVWRAPHVEPDPELLADFDRVGNRISRDLEVDRRFLGRIGIQRELYRRYRVGGEWVDFYLGVGNRSYRPRSALYTKAQLSGSGWNTRESGELRLEPGGHAADWRVAVTGARRDLVISWHEAADGMVAESLRSLAGLDQSPFRAEGDELAIRMSTPIIGGGPEDRARAQAQLLQFYAEIRPILDGLHTRLRHDTE
jgi:exosortase